MAKPSREYIYGVNPVFEVIRAGRRHAYEAYLNEASARQSRIKKLAGYLEQQEIPIQWVDKRRLTDLSSTREHQGAVLKTSAYQYAPSESLFDAPRLLLLDNVEDPHNVGAILRSAEIFGFKSVLLARRGVPDIYPSIVKVSAGATEFLDIAKDKSANGYVRLAHELGYQVVALDAKGSVDIRAAGAQLDEKVLVVIGGEDKSVGQLILNTAELVVSIQQHGRINSLNAAVAAGIALSNLAKPKP